MSQSNSFRVGYIGFVGRPNVGKSTLMNRILGLKLSITAPKPQTTRTQVMGIKTTEAGQLIMLDTPGIHQDAKKAINRYMNRAAQATLQQCDALCWIVDARHFSAEDELVGRQVRAAGTPLVIALNKVDLLDDKGQLLPLAERLQREFNPVAIVMISALKGDGVEELQSQLLSVLPAGDQIYSEDEITNRTERFLVAEFIREQLVRKLQKELPYAAAVEIEKYERDEKMLRIHAVILVERDGQKAIVIGKQGRTLKAIGQDARRSIENLLDEKVYLNLWVKVRQGWSDSDRALKSLGLTE